MEGFKQQLADQPALEPVDDLVELEEIVEEAEGDEEGEIPIRDCQVPWSWRLISRNLKNTPI